MPRIVIFSLTKDKKLTMQEIENSFGSNICRCTGYRPILEAFKGYASDAPASLKRDILDIEVIEKFRFNRQNFTLFGFVNFVQFHSVVV